jgi:lytic murein transglycosylase
MKKASLGLALVGTLCQFSAHATMTATAATPVNLAPPVLPKASCAKDTPNFGQWLQGVYRDAQALGVSNDVLAAAGPYLVSNPKVLYRDQHQGVFNQTWLVFSDRMVSQDRMSRGPQKLRAFAALFKKIEAEFGVPPEVLVAFWGLESDFNAPEKNAEKFSILTAVTTLAYDCRRADFFRQQLLDAFRIIQRGDQTAADWTGDWAGESGGMQITPSDYFKNAKDYDGDGRRDLIKSDIDTLASAANFLKSLGWKRGEPWISEVRVPATMAWEKADINVSLTRSEWLKLGLTGLQGNLPNDALPASLYLPMGRLGPAFLVYDNFKNGFMGWNSSMVYSLTAAYYARRLAGDGPAYRGNGDVVPLSDTDMRKLQETLVSHGYDIGGKPDSKLGSGTRIAIRKAQLKLGLPADAYPTLELLNQLGPAR